MRLSRYAALLVFTIGGASCVSPEEPSRPLVPSRSQAIIGGAPDTSDSAVVAIVQKSTGSLCSGTLIASDVVLTAAHCVYGVSPGDLQVLVGDDVSNPTQTIAVTSATAYPTYDGESDGIPGGIDLGVLTLASSPGIAPVPIRTAVADSELAGADVTLVGYGVESTTDTMTSGTREAVALSVTSVCSRLLTLGGADANACFGDSGGPVLLGGELVAVISGGSTDCIAPTDVVRLGAHLEWLAQVMAGSASSSCPSCVEPDPSCTAPIEGASGSDAGDGGANSSGSRASGGCALGRGSGPRSTASPPWGILALVIGFAAWGRARSRSSEPGRPRA